MWTIIKTMGDLTFDSKNRLLAILITTILIFCSTCSIFSSTIIEYIKKDEERNGYTMLYYIFYFVSILILSTLLILMFSRSAKHLKCKEEEKELKQQFNDELENVKRYLENIKKCKDFDDFNCQKEILNLNTRSILTCIDFEIQEKEKEYFVIILVTQNDKEVYADGFNILKPEPQKSKIIIN